MDLRYWSWSAVVICLLLNIFGLYWLMLLLLSFISFLLGVLLITYLQHYKELGLLNQNALEEGPPRLLGLNLACDQKPILLQTPDIKVHSDSNKNRTSPDIRKKSIIDSGIELFFKKSPKNPKDSFSNENVKNRLETTPGATTTIERFFDEKKEKWNPFETIKIYTDKRRHHETAITPNELNDVSVAEEYTHLPPSSPNPMPAYKLHNDAAELDQRGSPKRKVRAILSGSKQIDKLLHTIINYILRDFIESWFISLSDNKEFSDCRVRNSIEESLQNIATRIKNTQWIPLMTTKLVDNVAVHARLYRLATETVNLALDNDVKTINNKSNERDSPQRRNVSNSKLQEHRRNKSDTDLNRYVSGNGTKYSTKFYVDIGKKETEEKFIDPEIKLTNAFFNHSDLYRDECLDEQALEKYLTHCMETVLFYSLPEEDFACLPLRIFLSTLLANVVCKPLIEMLADPDFINVQVARLCAKDPPPAELFLKLLKQSDDLNELRACRQLITQEMDAKFKDTQASAELSSLKYTQKLIDMRISFLQNNNKNEANKHHEKPMSNLPILTLDELLTKELALSYYLDYLSIMNLQKYVIFYLVAQEWKSTANRCLLEVQMAKMKGSREETFRVLRNKASDIYKEYLMPTSPNLLSIDPGLIETLSIRIKNPTITPDNSWFDSMCKFVYEKMKNEEIFISNFYQSSAYRKLLLELEFCGNQESADLESQISHVSVDTGSAGSDSNSGDIQFDDDFEFDVDGATINSVPTPAIKSDTNISCNNSDNSKAIPAESLIGTTYDLCVLPILGIGGSVSSQGKQHLDVGPFKHSRSHSDCTGLNISEMNVTLLQTTVAGPVNKRPQSAGKTSPLAAKPIEIAVPPMAPSIPAIIDHSRYQQRLAAKIINTAINCDGQYAVYAIQVTVIEDNQQKSWHVYRRYSRFLDLKKLLVKRYPSIAQVPFPAKKAFQNTQRSVLEHRMTVLNEFLKIVCSRSDDNEDLHTMLRDFLEPDTNDKKIHGGAVIRTIETIVNPFKSGMRTIKNMPDTFVGGVAKMLLGKGPTRDTTTSFLDVTPIHLEHSSEYPALTCALNLLDEVFDLQARSQWLRRGLINRLLGAPWVSQTANKRIIQAAKSIIEVEKLEQILIAVLNNIWPDGKRATHQMPREENTKHRTRMAARMSLFDLLADDLKHVLGSETTRHGLLNGFQMWQHKTLNMRLALVLFNEILTNMYQIDDMTKHVQKKHR